MASTAIAVISRSAIPPIQRQRPLHVLLVNAFCSAVCSRSTILFTLESGVVSKHREEAVVRLQYSCKNALTQLSNLPVGRSSQNRVRNLIRAYDERHKWD